MDPNSGIDSRNVLSKLRGLAVLVAIAACGTSGPRPVDLESTLAVQALQDALTFGPRPDTVALLDHLRAATRASQDSSEWLEEFLPPQFRGRVPASLFYRYWRANHSPQALIPPRQVNGLPIRRVAGAEEGILSRDGGIYSLDRIGFSAGGDSALVMVRYACPGLCGSDHLYLYLHGPNGWERHRTLLSISH